MPRHAHAFALAALATTLSISCTTRVHSGHATTAMGSVQMDATDMAIRPAEVTWAVGDRLAFETTVRGDRVASDLTLSNVFYGGASGAGALPSAVKLACAQAVAKSGSDGLLLTHYLVESESELGVVTYTVKLYGRHLALRDLGVVSAGRMDALEGWNDRLRWLRSDDDDDDDGPKGGAGAPSGGTHE